MIPDSMTDMSGYAYSDCNNLTIYGSWGFYAFRYSFAHQIPFDVIDGDEAASE